MDIVEPEQYRKKRKAPDSGINPVESKRSRTELIADLEKAFNELTLTDKTLTDKDGSVDDLTDAFGKLNLGPIKVIIVPFAHGGVRELTKAERDDWIETDIKDKDVKLITSTSGTCTLIKPDSYITLLTKIASKVKFQYHDSGTGYGAGFDSQLLDWFNHLQNDILLQSGIPQTYPLKQSSIDDKKTGWELPYKESSIDVVTDTYSMSTLNKISNSTKIYEPIPKDDPLWPALQPVARIMGSSAEAYLEMPFVIYMYNDQNGNFRGGITPNTQNRITLHEILHIIHEKIKTDLPGKEMHYVVADPNCSAGDQGITFAGGRSSKKYKKNTKRSKKKSKKKSRKVRAKKGRKSVRK